MYKTKIEKLKEKILAGASDQNEFAEADLKTLNSVIEDCELYVTSVTTMERILTIQRHRLEPEAYRAAMQRADSTRKAYHDGVMAGFNVVNRMSTKLYGGEELFVFADRHEAAEIAIAVVDDYFESGQTG